MKLKSRLSVSNCSTHPAGSGNWAVNGAPNGAPNEVPSDAPHAQKEPGGGDRNRYGRSDEFEFEF